MSVRQTYVFQMTRNHPCGTPYWDKLFSRNACSADQFYITTLVWTCDCKFPVKQVTHVAAAKSFTWMKARDVETENQVKSSFFCDILSTR